LTSINFDIEYYRESYGRNNYVHCSVIVKI